MTLAQFGLLWERKRVIYEQSLHGAALVCSVLAEINRDKKKRSKAFTPADFLPKKQKPKSEGQTPEQMLAIWQALLGPPKQ
jgi:hypothetical protein